MSHKGPSDTSGLVGGIDRLGLTEDGAPPKKKPGMSLEKGHVLTDKESKSIYTNTGSYNTWYPGVHAPTFQVRKKGYTTPHHANEKKKSSSGGFLYDVFDIDFVKTPRACRHISRSLTIRTWKVLSRWTASQAFSF